MTRSICSPILFAVAVIVAGWSQIAIGQEAAAPAAQGGLSAPEIIKRMADKYAACKTYSDSGTVTTVYHSAEGKENKDFKQFSTAMIRPDRFRFQYTDDRGPEGRYLIWRKGDDVRTWWGITKKQERPEDLGMAIAGATGVSGGSAHTIPALMMPDELGGRTLKNLESPKLSEEQKLGDKDCFVIEAKYADNPMSIWIEKTSFLVLRIDQSTTFDDFSTEETTLYRPSLKEVGEDQLMSVPVFFLYVDGTHVADLSDPQREDMYWYSYLVTPTSGSANATLRDDKTWESVNFTIKDQDGQVPKADTFSGGYDLFCRGETNRLSFRSLDPTTPEQFNWQDKYLWFVIALILASFCLLLIKGDFKYSDYTGLVVGGMLLFNHLAFQCKLPLGYDVLAKYVAGTWVVLGGLYIVSVFFVSS